MNDDIKVKKLGNLNGHTGGSFAYMVYDADGLAPTLNCMEGGGREPMILEEITDSMCCAMRGRYQEDGFTKQQLELYHDDTSHAITTVSKDMMVLEKVDMVGVKQATKKGYTECEIGGVLDLSYPESTTRRGRVQSKGRICPTVTASNLGICRIESIGDGEVDKIETKKSKYRIRKLTPKEVWRLMNISDDDYEKAASVNSKTQLYKEAGNSICVNVLTAIFGQLFEGKEDIYKEINNSVDKITNEVIDMSVKTNLFQDVLDKFETEEMRLYCEDMINLVDGEVWIIPSSTTGKFHNSTQCEIGGSFYHTLMVGTIGNHLLGLKYMQEKFPQAKKRDCMRVALLLHDACKTNGGRYTVHEHPMLAAEWVQNTTVEHDIKQGLKDYIGRLIQSHSGQWTSSKRSSVVLPEPENDEQFFIHLCDYLGSRNNLDMIYTDENKVALKALVKERYPNDN